MTRASTLIEVLAAVAILSLLAAAIVPLHRSMASAARRDADGLTAEIALRQALSTGAIREGDTPLEGRAGWRLVIAPIPLQGPSARQPPLSYGWWGCAVVADGTTLAETVMVQAAP